MGYGIYKIQRNDELIEAGYLVSAECEEAECRERIDRGLAYLCGETPGGDEFGCGGYFCDKDLYVASTGEGSRCIRCCDRKIDPLEPTDDAMVVTFSGEV